MTRTGATTAVFNPLTLSFYDYSVVWFSNQFVWRCPARHIQALYNRHIRPRHLDIGVGTGYFLDRCAMPASPSITLLDLNTHSLAAAAQRIRRYAPAAVHADVMQPLLVPRGSMESVGMSYLLHCMPGASLHDKAPAVRHAREALGSGGVLFGATILGDQARHSPAARRLLQVYQRTAIFGNAGDTADDLAALLHTCFDRVDVQVRNSVALFAAWVG